MKKLTLAMILLLLAISTQAQILDKIKRKVQDKVNREIDKKTDQAVDTAIDKTEKTVTDKPTDNKSGSTNKTESSSATPSAKTGAVTTLATYSKYDFIPGEKVVVYEDFSQDAIGDFPAKWNTNSSGEVVTVDGQTGHWLMLRKQGRFIPNYITSLPDNFTLEFDLMSNEKYNFYSPSFNLYLLTGGNSKDAFENGFIEIQKRSGVLLKFDPTDAGATRGTTSISTYENGERVINNEVSTTQFNSYHGKNKVKVSLWRQKERIRVYLNEEKVLDLPRAFAADKPYNTLLFEIWGNMNNEVDRYLVDNIKLAVGAPDTRNKLITEGKFSTTGILFDVNSATIRPESYGTLKQIADVLQENASVRIKIVGHTDSDGDDAANLDLSKRRAQSVKEALSKDFNIDASRMETDGKGESQPAQPNTSAAGKAANRRVELIKL